MRKTSIKLRVNPTGTASENLEHHIIELLDKNYFPRYKYQLSYLAKFSKIVNGEENVFHKWVKSDLNHNHMQSTFGTNLNVHNTLMQKLDDEQLEGSGFVFNGIANVIIQKYIKSMIFKLLHTLSCQKNIRITINYEYKK